MGEWCDLDLVVVAETDLPFYERMKQVLHLVHPKAGMDILVYTPDEWSELTSQRLFVKDEILAKGKVVYERAC